MKCYFRVLKSLICYWKFNVYDNAVRYCIKYFRIHWLIHLGFIKMTSSQLKFSGLDSSHVRAFHGYRAEVMCLNSVPSLTNFRAFFSQPPNLHASAMMRHVYKSSLICLSIDVTMFPLTHSLMSVTTHRKLTFVNLVIVPAVQIICVCSYSHIAFAISYIYTTTIHC